MTTGLTAQPTNSPEHVLVLTSDRPVLEAVTSALTSPWFDVRHAADSATAARLATEWQPDLGIVDLEIHQGGLREWATPAVAGVVGLPAIAVTRRNDLAIRLEAFDRGADDVLILPFAPQELVARVRALIRRTRPQPIAHTPALRIGDLEIDLVRRRGTLGDADLELTPVEQSLLYLLATNPGRVLTRDDILSALWGPDYVSESNLIDRHIRSLRTKLHDSWRTPRFIATVAGQGYRFIGTHFDTLPGQQNRLHGSARRPPLHLVGEAHEPISDRAGGGRLAGGWYLAA